MLYYNYNINHLSVKLMAKLCNCAIQNAFLPCWWIDLVKAWITDPYFSFYAILWNNRNLRRTLLAKHLATIPTMVLKITQEQNKDQHHCNNCGFNLFSGQFDLIFFFVSRSHWQDYIKLVWVQTKNIICLTLLHAHISTC